MKIVITESENGKTVKELIRNGLGLSGTLVKELKRLEDGILLNGTRVTVRAVLNTGDILEIACERENESSTVIPQEGECDIICEDESIIAFRKPSGMPTHPSRGHLTDTLANAAAYIFAKRGVPFVFRAITRLDNDVSGIVLCAANKMCAARLSADIAKGRIKKYYLALCDGAPMSAGTCGTVRGYVRREQTSIITRVFSPDGEGALAITEYKVLAENGSRSLLLLSPITGRTHQLRLTAAYLGCPICGDGFYGNEDTAARCMLHAARLELYHPASGKETVLYAPLYPDMEKLIKENFGELPNGYQR